MIKQEATNYIKRLEYRLISNYLRKEYFDYRKHEIIRTLLCLAKDFSNSKHDDVFEYLESVDENRYLFHKIVFQKISENTYFFPKENWNEIINLHHAAFDLFKPNWWDKIRIPTKNWINISTKAITLLKKLEIPIIDADDYGDKYIDDGILLKLLKFNNQ